MIEITPAEQMELDEGRRFEFGDIVVDEYGVRGVVIGAKITFPEIKAFWYYDVVFENGAASVSRGKDFHGEGTYK